MSAGAGADEFSTESPVDAEGDFGDTGACLQIIASIIASVAGYVATTFFLACLYEERRLKLVPGKPPLPVKSY